MADFMSAEIGPNEDEMSRHEREGGSQQEEKNEPTMRYLYTPLAVGFIGRLGLFIGRS
jgi:hypothetical protein